jgi:DNA-binding transcriptional LysR family regulator
MNIEQLYTFQEVARLGSFSEVAKKLGISQPAVSFQIQKLEQELGVRLIDRSQRALTLTGAGKRLLDFAEAVDMQRKHLQYDLEQMRDEIAGDLHLNASTIPGEYLLPPLLARFKERHPAVRIQVDVSDSVTVIERISGNAGEIGFCGIVPEGQDLEYFRIAGDEIVLIVPPEHPFAKKADVTPDELTGEPFIFREATSGTQRSLQDCLSKAGVDIMKWTPHLILGSTQAVLLAVAASAGVAFVSDIAVKSLTTGRVTQVSVRGLKLERDFYCIYRKERIVTRLHHEFINFVQYHAKSN